MGSTGLDKLKEQNTGGNNPGVEGALDVDPDVIGGYTCATAEAAGVKFELTTLAKMGRFDQEVSIDMPAASDIPRLETIQVKPVCMGFEDFYAGWAPETPPGFTVSPIQGRMERRGGEPSVFDIEVQSDGRSRRPGVLRWFHFVDVTRVHRTMTWVVSLSILGPFGPRRSAQVKPARRSATSASSCPTTTSSSRSR